MKKKNRFRTKLLALVMTAALAAVQAPMPVCAEEIPQETAEQAAGTGEITMPEQTAEQSAPLTEPQPAEEAPAVLEEGEKPAESEELPSEEALAVSAQEVPREEAAGQDAVPEIEAAEIEEPAGDVGPIEVVSWNGLQEAFNNASGTKDSPTRITLSGDVAIPEEIDIYQKKFGTNLVVPAGKYVVLDLNDHTIDRKLGSYSSYAFSQYLEIMEAMNVITVSGNLTLEDSSDENTGKITGGYGLPAGGVTVTSGASFTMKGGRITGNKACLAYGHYVGGVYVAKGAQFLMEGGSIDDNKNADGSGGAGGVFVSGSFTMSGNSSITNNNEGCKGTGGVKVYGQGASFTMNGGTIKGNHSDDGQGGGVYVLNGTFEMNDGAIEGNESKNADLSGGGGVCVDGSDATFTMRGGRINGNTVSVTGTYDRCGGGGVLVSGGTFTMEGGSISGNKVDVKGKLSGGGGVYVLGGTFNMKSGSISGNSVSGNNAECGGGGVLINNSGKFTMEDGSITGNTADVTGAKSGGGGVYSGGGFFTMEGGSITGNTANVTGAESGGGGVYSSHGIFTMKGGSISGNNISSGASGGGGVYVCPHGNPDFEKFELSGTPIIRGNVKGGALSGEVYSGGTKSNVWLYSDDNKKAVIYDVTGLKDGAEIWVGSESEEIVYDASESSVKYLHVDDDALLAVFEYGYIYLREKTTWPWLQGKFASASESEASPTRICMNYDAVAGESDNFLTVPNGKYVELDLNGFRIDRGLAVEGADYYGNVIRVDGNLTLADSSDNSETPEYDGTGAITGGSNKGYGGGVYVAENGTFTMEGGSISGNNVNFSEGYVNDSGGGGVYVNIDGTFTMKGGSISGNNVNVSSGQVSRFGGGGVYVYRGSFTMKGGSISGNNVTANANDSGGGGVYVSSEGTFTMEGGIVTGNNTSDQGGGVFLNYDSSFKISGKPVIKGNVRNGTQSGGVYTGDNANNVLPWGSSISVIGELTEGAEIWVNGNKGWRIAQGTESHTISMDDVKYFHSDNDRFAPTLEGDKITLGMKTDWAGLQLQFDAASGSKDSPTKIYMNQAAVAGGSDSALTVPAGRYVELDLNGFKIDRGLSGNWAKPDGNIITVSGNLTLKDSQGTGILTGGNSTGKAGGVQVSGGGVFSMKGGRIALNLTVGIGGVWVSENGVFRMTGGEITQNVGRAGGGVGFEGSSFELGGDPKIFGNVKGGVIQYGEIKDGETNNVNVYSGKTISINGAMTNTTPVGVTTVPSPEGEEQIIFTDNWGAYMQGKSPTEFFSSDNEKYSVVVRDGAAALVGHVHKLTYRAEGGTITADCSGDKNCGFPEHTATLTISAPEYKVYADGASPEAQITDDYQIQGTASVNYYAADGTKLDSAPLDVGRYRAEITLGEATAYVVYEIEKAVPVYIIPTGLTAVYGQTLEDVKLPVSDNGVWTWAEKEASVGDAGENTFKAVYTPNDADNYKTVTVDVAVTVAKADYTKTSLSASVRYGTTGMIELKDNIPEGGVPGLPKAAGDTEVLSGNAVIIGDVLSCTLKDDRAYVGKVVTFTIPVTFCKNYKDYSLILTLTVKDCSHPATVLKNAKAATCTEKGYSGDLCCRDCNALIKKGEETPIDPSNHDFDYENGVVTREATYLYYGEHTYSCRRDESHKTTRADIEPLPAKDDRDYSDFAEDTKSLSGNEISCNKVEDPVTKAVTETVSIAGEEISKTVTDPVSGKETVTTKVWIGGLREFYTYTGSAIKPSVNVYDGTVKLAEKTDYTVKYSDNKDVGTASITVKFKGNYKDTKSETVKFEIKSAALGTDILAHEIGTAAKKKGSVKVSPILTWADTGKTVSSKYFNIDPSSVKGEGSFTATITPKSGQRNYTGSVTVTIKATGDKNKLINSAKVTFDKKSYAYTGSPIEPKYTVTLGGKTLTEGKDYRRVSLCGNTDPGKGTIVLEAVNGNPAGYVGSKTASFKISGRKELKEDKSFSFTCSDSVPYAKGGARAFVTVRDNDNEITLKEGRDYTLSYAKNKAVTNGTRSAEVKIKGKGNYKGSVILKFAVAQQSLSALSENIAAADQFTTKAKLKKPSITITDLDGRKLKAGKDYIVGEKDDRAEGNTESSGVVYITLKGQGDYTGEATAVFRYMQTASSNIGKAKTVKKLQEQTYTGNAVKLSNAELTGVLKLNGNTLEPGKDFKIKGYSNNVKKGKAKVTVQGIGGYGGTKTLTFKIVQRKVTYQGALVGDKFI